MYNFAPPAGPEDLASMITAFQDFAATKAPPQMGVRIGIGQLDGVIIVFQIHGVFYGPRAAFEEAFAPLAATVPSPSSSNITELAYLDVVRSLDETGILNSTIAPLQVSFTPHFILGCILKIARSTTAATQRASSYRSRSPLPHGRILQLTVSQLLLPLVCCGILRSMRLAVLTRGRRMASRVYRSRTLPSAAGTPSYSFRCKKVLDDCCICCSHATSGCQLRSRGRIQTQVLHGSRAGNRPFRRAPRPKARRPARMHATSSKSQFLSFRLQLSHCDLFQRAFYRDRSPRHLFRAAKDGQARGDQA